MEGEQEEGTGAAAAVAAARLRRILAQAGLVSVNAKSLVGAWSATGAASLGQQQSAATGSAVGRARQQLAMEGDCANAIATWNGSSEQERRSSSSSSRTRGFEVHKQKLAQVEGDAIGPVAQDCVFCKIVHGYEPAFKLYEDEFCICILDINPLCYGHSLLVPKGHFPSLDVTPPRVAAAMCGVVPLISNVIMEATSCDAFNLVVNSGEAAGQVVFHTHFHIVPRFNGDGLWTNESVHRKSLSTFKDPLALTHVVRSKLSQRAAAEA